MCVACHSSLISSEADIEVTFRVTMCVKRIYLKCALIVPIKLKLKLIYDRQSVGQSVLVSGTHVGSATNFSFSLKFPLDNYVFIL
jgi:hypothetical protein